MKYIDTECLKAEIEKRMHICEGVFERDSDTYYQGKAVAYQETLSFIDSLKQEQPHWEPSEVQMNELFQALIPDAEYDCDILQELYFGLKSWLDSIHN